MKKALFTCCLAAILVLGTSVPGMTQGKIRISEKLTLPLGMTLESVFDDNIFLGNGTNNTTEAEVDDTILHIKPNVGINYTMPQRGNIFAGYEGDWAHYASESDNNWKTHKGLFQVNYQAPVGFIFGIDEVYADAADPYGDATLFGLGRPQTERIYNDFKSKVGWNFGGSVKVLGFYNNYFQEYDEEFDKTQDHKDQEFGGGVEYKGLAKTWVFARYHYGTVDWDGRPDPTAPFVPAALGGLDDSNDADYSYHRVNAGLTWDPDSKITGELNLGYQWNSFDNDTDLSGSQYQEDDTWIAQTVINWQALENTLVFASVLRAYRVTAGFSNEYFEDTGAAVGIRHSFFTKFTIDAQANAFNHDYNNNRDDDLWSAMAKLTYDIQEWFSVGASYRYRERSSNVTAVEYENNQIALFASFQF